MARLEGLVAVVTDGGSEIGRAVALALSARGVRVVVSGPIERALAETVGEIAYGGGMARHVVGDPARAVERAVTELGGLDIVVAADPENAEYTFRAAAARAPDPARLVAIRADAVAELSPEELAEHVVQRCLGA